MAVKSDGVVPEEAEEEVVVQELEEVVQEEELLVECQANISDLPCPTVLVQLLVPDV